ncbi:hypothetical protein BDW22DRAFT_1349563, partial [Trametopsis cervina]
PARLGRSHVLGTWSKVNFHGTRYQFYTLANMSYFARVYDPKGKQTNTSYWLVNEPYIHATTADIEEIAARGDQRRYTDSDDSLSDEKLGAVCAENSHNHDALRAYPESSNSLATAQNPKSNPDGMETVDGKIAFGNLTRFEVTKTSSVAAEDVVNEGVFQFGNLNSFAIRDKSPSPTAKDISEHSVLEFGTLNSFAFHDTSPSPTAKDSHERSVLEFGNPNRFAFRDTSPSPTAEDIREHSVLEFGTLNSFAVRNTSPSPTANDSPKRSLVEFGTLSNFAFRDALPSPTAENSRERS